MRVPVVIPLPPSPTSRIVEGKQHDTIRRSHREEGKPSGTRREGKPSKSILGLGQRGNLSFGPKRGKNHFPAHIICGGTLTCETNLPKFGFLLRFTQAFHGQSSCYHGSRPQELVVGVAALELLLSNKRRRDGNRVWFLFSSCRAHYFQGGLGRPCRSSHLVQGTDILYCLQRLANLNGIRGWRHLSLDLTRVTSVRTKIIFRAPFPRRGFDTCTQIFSPSSITIV